MAQNILFANQVQSAESRSWPRRVILANGVFSTVTGAGMALFSTPIAEYMGVSPTAILILGVGVVVFASLLFMWSRRNTLTRERLMLIFAADVAWVTASVIILLTDAFAMTDGGKLVVLVVALIVGDFALFEGIGWRRWRTA